MRLHIVTDWVERLDTQSGESPLTEKRLDTEPRQADCNAGETLGTQDGDVGSALDELSLSEAIHGVIGCLDGESFYGFDIVETSTNHNHEDIVESIDTYQCVAYRQF